MILSLFAIVLALIINQPVGKLEKKGMKRWQAATLILGSIFTVITLLMILVVPHISTQIDALIGNLPSYLNSVSLYLNKILQKYPELGKELQAEGFSLSTVMPALDKTVISLGNFSFSVLGGLFLFIVFVSMIVFFVGNPKPVIELYLSVFEPNQRTKAEKALQNTSIMLGGWMKSNLIGGIIQAISATMNIHPVSLLFLLLAMAAAFGLMGALLATPMAAIIKAYYEEFYLKRFNHDPQMDERIERILDA